jgi:hypothetical protein
MTTRESLSRLRQMQATLAAWDGYTSPDGAANIEALGIAIEIMQRVEDNAPKPPSHQAPEPAAR